MALPLETPLPEPTPNPIRVVRVMPHTLVTGNEDYHLNNCSAATTMRQPFWDAAQLWTEVVVSDRATLSDGTIISVPDSVRWDIAHEVELAYQDSLATVSAMVHGSVMLAPPFTRWYVIVIWKDLTYSANVSFPSDGATAVAAYTYTQHVPEMGPIKTAPCTA
jgi:hypothetical protein